VDQVQYDEKIFATLHKLEEKYDKQFAVVFPVATYLFADNVQFTAAQAA